MRILVVAYYFPPCGGGGVQRISKLCKFLHVFGHEITVLTADPSNYSTVDESLSLDVPEGIRVLRVNDGSCMKRALLGFRKHPKYLLLRLCTKAINKAAKMVRRNFCVPDLEIFWAREAVRYGRKAFKEGQFDAVLSTSSPYSSHLAGLRISRRLGIPFVADFRDPWLRNHYAPIGGLGFRRHYRLEKEVVTSASRVVVVSEPMVDLLLKDHEELDRGKTECITNGYDEEDFRGFGRKKGSCFEILFAGSIYGAIRLDELAAATALAWQEAGVEESPFMFKAIGKKNKPAEEKLKELSSRGILVESRDYVPHSEIIRAYETASLLVLILPAVSSENLYYSGKIFEYLRVGAPILALAGEGVAVDLLRRTRAGDGVDPSDIGKISAAIAERYRAWIRNEEFSPDMTAISRFSRMSLAKDYEGLLLGVRDTAR